MVSMTRADVQRAKYRLMRLAEGYESTVPLGVNPSRGQYGSPRDWDNFTSVCDARIALVLAMGKQPNLCTGHVVTA